MRNTYRKTILLSFHAHCHRWTCLVITDGHVFKNPVSKWRKLFKCYRILPTKLPTLSNILYIKQNTRNNGTIFRIWLGIPFF